MSLPIVYDKFIELQQFTDDDYWRELLASCARNKFPKGIRYYHAEQTLSVRYEQGGKPHTDVFTIPDLSVKNKEYTNNLKKFYNLFMHILQFLLNLRSNQDILESKNQLENIRKENEVNVDCGWKKLKPRCMKNIFLMNYALMLTEKYGISTSTASTNTATELYNLIQLGFQIKKLNSDDVQYENGRIIKITGLKFKKEEQKFKLTNKRNTNIRVAAIKNKDTHINPTEKAINKWIKDFSNTM
jgi:hypothetical protein